MATPQSAILPEDPRFAQYTLLKVKGNEQQVIAQLKTLTTLVAELNKEQVGANLYLSIAFAANFWKKVSNSSPEELITFPQYGQGEITAPATEDADIFIHLHSTRPDLHFYIISKFMTEVADSVEIIDEASGFRYLDARDMTGFIDGTENPDGAEARQEVAIIPEGEFAGGSYVLVQRFIHKLAPWNKLSIDKQEKIIGRTKPDSIELDDVPADSHVGRVDIKEEGKGLKLVRHSLPYGSVGSDHGLLFLAYCATLHNFDVMLKSMYGEKDGTTDMMLNFSQAVTGAYFFAPSEEMLAAL